MKKKVFGIFLALVMVLSLVPTVALAEENTGKTTIRLSVAESEATYELVIPSGLDVTSSGYNALGNGITIKNLTNADKISSIIVSATSANSWNLTDASSNQIPYKLVASDAQDTAKTTYSFTDKTSMATSDGSTIACGVNVSDYSTATAGEYSDTITWTANVVNCTGVVVNGDGTKTVTLTKDIMGSKTCINAGESVTSNDVTIRVNIGTISTEYYESASWRWLANYDTRGKDFTISTVNGLFTRIEIVGEAIALCNAEWTQESGKVVWTGSSSSVDVGRCFDHVTAVICTIEY